MQAEDRAGQLFKLPSDSMPRLARSFSAELARRYGLSTSVILHAFTVYAVVCEGFPAEDGFTIKEDEQEWFDKRMKSGAEDDSKSRVCDNSDA